MSPNRSCGVVIGPERADDPELTDEVDRLARLYEGTLKEVLTGPGLIEAGALIANFEISARRIAKTPFEATYAKRLELSLGLHVFWRFGGDLEEAARTASEFVQLPCHRRIAQCYEISNFAATCRDRGRPEVGWEPLRAAFQVAETELAHQEIWLQQREVFLEPLNRLWLMISPEIRASLTPLISGEHNPH